MSAKPDPATVALDSKKGQQRAERIRGRIDYLAGQEHYTAKALASALSWALARLERLEEEIAKRRRTISQAQATAIIEAWRDSHGIMLAVRVPEDMADGYAQADAAPRATASVRWTVEGEEWNVTRWHATVIDEVVLDGLDLEGLGIR